jgi:superfamily II DNA helicase RecQ
MAYHAGMSKGMRYKIQTQFSEGDINIIVSTVAFGMGIDQIVRCVLIFGAPNSIEDYYQMIGRAGRDGFVAETILFFQYKNIIVGKHMNSKKTQAVNNTDPFEDNMEQNTDSKESAEILKNKQLCLDRMAKYFYTKTCRRRFILEYFGQIPKFFCCYNCDNCSEKVMVDYTDRIKNIVFNKTKAKIQYSDVFNEDELMTMSKANLISKTGDRYYECTILKNWIKLLTVNNLIDCIPKKYKILLN